MLEALTIAAAISLEIARVFEEIGIHLDRNDGALPEWEREVNEWRKKNPGTEGLN